MFDQIASHDQSRQLQQRIDRLIFGDEVPESMILVGDWAGPTVQNVLNPVK